MYYIPDLGNTETYLVERADLNRHSSTIVIGQTESMNTNPAPEFFVDPNMYLPTAANYGYYCTGYQSSGEWDDHPRFFGVDGSDIYAGAQAENLPYVYYTPSYGYADSAYNPYNPYIPGAVVGVDGSYVGTQAYYSVSPYQSPAPSSGYVPVLVQSRPDVVASSSTDPMIDRGSSATNRVSAAGVKSTNSAAPARFSFTPGKPVSSQANPFTRASESTRINSATSKPSFTHRTNAGRNYEASSFLPQGGSSSVSSQIMDNISRRKALSSPKDSNDPMVMGGFFSVYDPNTAGRAVLDGHYKIANDTNGTPDTFAEQNRGPRIDKSKHELIVKAYTTKAGNIDSHGNIIISTDAYNRDDFRVDHVNAKFFVIKSYSEDDVHKSIKYNVWSSTTNGNRKLNSGYEDAQLIASGKARTCPVFLYFSVNASGQFCGVAEMVGPVDFNKDMDFWQQDKWSGSFPVKWHIIKDVPNNNFRHIILENNEHRPVTNSRGEVETIPSLLPRFHSPGTLRSLTLYPLFPAFFSSVVSFTVGTDLAQEIIMASDVPMQVTSHVGCSHRGDELCHVPSTHLDPSEWAFKKSETVLKAYLEEKEEVMHMREHSPHLDVIPKPHNELVQRNCIETRILLNKGLVSRRHRRILEIFSISIHWNEKEHIARIFYHVFGNVLVSDTYDGGDCCLEAMNTSLRHPFTVLNGGHLPLRGLVRCFWYRPFIALIMFLRGHRIDSSGNCFEKESRVLIRKRLKLPMPSLPQPKEGWLCKPIERTVVGADEADDHLPFFKIRYSVVPEAFVVAVEVRLVWGKKEKFESGEISIKGRLSVHWLEFEYLDRLCDYKIMLFDSKQESVSVGECFSTLRRMLAVPCGHTLVFDAAIYTEKGHEFIGQQSILVQRDDNFLVRTFGDGPLKMQITLFNFFHR